MTSKVEMVRRVAHLTEELNALKQFVAMEELNGSESAILRGKYFAATAEHAREKYGLDIATNMTGCESLMTFIKDAIMASKEFLKGKPDKSDLAQIKKYTYQAREAAEGYASSDWLDKQEFLTGIVEVKSVPGVFTSVKSPDQLASSIGKDLANLNNHVKKNTAECKKEMAPAYAIYKKYYTADFESKREDAVKELSGLKPSTYDKGPVYPMFVKGNVSTRELPALDKAGVKKIADLMVKIVTTYGILDDHIYKSLVPQAIEWDDLTRSKFWNEFYEQDYHLKELSALFDVLSWDDTTKNSSGNLHHWWDTVWDVVRFLENWILYSVK